MHQLASRDLAHYEDGVVTWDGLIVRLILLAMEVDPSEYYDELPDNVKAGIRECIEEFSEDPSDHLAIGGVVVYGSDEEVREAMRRKQEHSFDAHMKMRHHVFGEHPPNV